MFENVIKKTVALPDGREISLETGRMARQADGSIVLRMGNTMLLATVVSNPEKREGADFLPLSVDYQEKFASAGKIPGGFLKREGRLSDREILISRLVDRAIRPLFPSDYYHDTQIMISMISADKDALPDALVALAASAALSITDIPFDGPISEVRVIKDTNGEYIVNPTPAQMEGCTLDLMIGATAENITMVEGEMQEVGEDEMIEAIKVGHEAIKTQCAIQVELREAVGVTEYREFVGDVEDEALKEEVFTALYDKLYAVAAQGIKGKSERKAAFTEVKKAYFEALPEDEETEEKLPLIKRYVAKCEKKASRDLVLNTKNRLDGRDLEEVRPIVPEVDVLPSAHGSALFTRGETQSLTTVTLGTKMDEQMLDSAMESSSSKFILHYNFPGFSTGEVRPNRGPGRREVGHGNLGHRALQRVLPPENENPYTIRIVSDILESNGSSSMATVCAGSLALMDAGVNITGTVSGIAMGMISENDPDTGELKYAILSDILGDEDHLGDMDFKVTGTEKGITACQMDIKVDGLPYEVLKQALEQANRGRAHIREVMDEVISTSRDDLKPHAPRSFVMMIPQDLIGAVIGPGGKVIQEIQKDTGATIVIEEVENQGQVSFFAVDKVAMDGAVDRVKAIVAQPEVGETYPGTVKSLQPFGAFVEFMPGKEGLLHISEIAWERTDNVESILKVGDKVDIKLLEIDPKTGKFKLSRKALLPMPEGYTPPPPRERRDRNDRGGDRRGGFNRGGDRGDRRDRGDRGDRGGYNRR
ncbi:polyribonucleotide nucleotidyltransferase [Flammeovirga sp. EKP202]|uniref:polyribonucleotide nucleotidyltransferase n=1 Tax=Flammeovirga sp. EKP202 TaxID=2770592 RepID=UPI00165EEF43|nr:polyribonucleotide nucleotidyltransferase [Flammeovirga sp. EKP202]MBD0404766.1 polyribonucleotide nucleotidyltransferase [Flammeovirga sp. EKP202]